MGRTGPGRTIVLLYHRVARVDRDPHQLCVDPSRFAAQLGLLAGRAEIIRLDEVLTPSVTDRIAITFDDGYSDNLYEAKPRLTAQGCPATVFVASAYTRSGGPFWWDSLDRLLTEQSPVSHVRLRHDGRQLVADVRTPLGRSRLHAALVARLRRMPVSEIEPLLRDLGDQLRWNMGEPAARAMSADEVRELVVGGVVEVGAHTRTHSAMSTLPRRVQREEAEGSRHDLEAMLGHPVRQFAYPFGNHGSFTPASERAVRRAGFELACWNVEGAVSPSTHRLRVRRHLVRDWSAEELARHLDDWLRS